MCILTIDTSTKSGSLAIRCSSEETVELVGDASLTHGERLPNDIARLLERGKVNLADVEVFGVGIGPGSFTSLRVGIATVQALAITQNRKVAPVPTLDAVAAARMAEKYPMELLRPPDHDSIQGIRILAWMDGQRGHVFAGLYRIERTATGFIRPVCIDGPQVGSPIEVLDSLRTLFRKFDTRLTLEVVGSAATRDEDILLSRLSNVSSDVFVARGESTLASVMANLVASKQYAPVGPEELQPLYVRRPDAVLARERRMTSE
jgi:tRNA threonylcarbamoyl adenosine modification protein YeaZ